MCVVADMTKRFLVMVTCLLATQVQADTYQCQAEVGAGVEQIGSSHLDANIYHAKDMRLTLSKRTGQWQLWENPEQEAIFVSCHDQYKCLPEEGFFGTFYMSKELVFTYIIQKAYGRDLSRQIVFTYKGRCQKQN